LSEYSTDYRNNERVIVTIQPMCDVLWDRVKDFCPSTMSHGSRTMWSAVGLNERFRFCRYTKGEHFSPHNDACFRRNSKEQSFLTFMIYLNTPTEECGGTTNFLREHISYKSNEDRILKKVHPVAGMVLIFQHNILHEGQLLTGGKKYLMRSDVMYREQTEMEHKSNEDGNIDGDSGGNNKNNNNNNSSNNNNNISTKDEDDSSSDMDDQVM